MVVVCRIKECEGIDKEMLKNEMLKASKDPMFLKDLNECMKDFELVDEESARNMNKPGYLDLEG